MTANIASSLRGILVRGAKQVKTTTAKKECATTLIDRPLMDLLDIPHGPWEELNALRQRKNNIQLGLGISFMTGTLIFAYNKRLLWFRYTVLPPEVMEDIENRKKEKEKKKALEREKESNKKDIVTSSLGLLLESKQTEEVI